jgi:hypothetical protein
MGEQPASPPDVAVAVDGEVTQNAAAKQRAKDHPLHRKVSAVAQGIYEVFIVVEEFALLFVRDVCNEDDAARRISIQSYIVAITTLLVADLCLVIASGRFDRESHRGLAVASNAFGHTLRVAMVCLDIALLAFVWSSTDSDCDVFGLVIMSTICTVIIILGIFATEVVTAVELSDLLWETGWLGTGKGQRSRDSIFWMFYTILILGGWGVVEVFVGIVELHYLSDPPPDDSKCTMGSTPFDVTVLSFVLLLVIYVTIISNGWAITLIWGNAAAVFSINCCVMAVLCAFLGATDLPLRCRSRLPGRWWHRGDTHGISFDLRVAGLLLRLLRCRSEGQILSRSQVGQHGHRRGHAEH